MKHQLDSREQIEVLTDHDIFHELNEHFGICIRDELNALFNQFRFQVGIVLNDTVMDESKILGFRIMRMGITRRRLTMGCPTGVGNSQAASDIFIGTVSLQIAYLAFCLVNTQIAFGIQQCHAGTIIAAIFESFKSFYQNRISLTLTDVSYYSAHIFCCVVACLCLFKFYFVLSITFTISVAEETKTLASENQRWVDVPIEAFVFLMLLGST